MNKVEQVIKALRDAAYMHEECPEIFKSHEGFTLLKVTPDLLRTEADRIEERYRQTREVFLEDSIDED